MSYHVSILRTVENGESPIEIDEIMSAIKALEGWEYHHDNDKSFTYSVSGEEIVCLWLSKGKLWAKNPTEEAITSMLHLANALDARVRGDEYETYKSATEFYIHQHDLPNVNIKKSESAKRERNAKIRHYIFRTYQVVTISILIYVAIKWSIKHL